MYKVDFILRRVKIVISVAHLVKSFLSLSYVIRANFLKKDYYSFISIHPVTNLNYRRSNASFNPKPNNCQASINHTHHKKLFHCIYPWLHELREEGQKEHSDLWIKRIG